MGWSAVWWDKLKPADESSGPQTAEERLFVSALTSRRYTAILWTEGKWHVRRRWKELQRNITGKKKLYIKESLCETQIKTHLCHLFMCLCSLLLGFRRSNSEDNILCFCLCFVFVYNFVGFLYIFVLLSVFFVYIFGVIVFIFYLTLVLS